MAGIIINQKYREANHEQNVCRYSDYYIYDEDTGIRKTLLHVAAEGYSNARDSQKSVESHHMKRNFTDIAKILISSCPGLVYSTTEGEKWGKLPVELALLNFDDEMASLLIKSMLEKCRLVMLGICLYQKINIYIAQKRLIKGNRYEITSRKKKNRLCDGVGV